MTQAKLRKPNGFTIVEMIIVVVVIAILAAITTVAYTGMQERAKQTVTLNAFDQYEQLLRAYKTSKGYFPDTVKIALDGSSTVTDPDANPAGYVCLGNVAPADPPFAANECATGLSTKQSAAVDTALKTINPKLPDSTGNTITSSDGSFSMRGIAYAAQRYADGTPGIVNMFFGTRDKSCGRGTYYAPNTTLDATGLTLPIAVCLLVLSR